MIVSIVLLILACLCLLVAYVLESIAHNNTKMDVDQARFLERYHSDDAKFWEQLYRQTARLRDAWQLLAERQNERHCQCKK